MIYQGSDASPGARTNGSPLPKRHIRRAGAGAGARATITYSYPYSLRGGAVPPVRRLRSEPMRKHGSSQYGSGAMSPTRLSPTAADWVPQRSSTVTPTPSPVAGRAKGPPFLSYAAVAKLSQSRPLLAPLPPPRLPPRLQPRLQPRPPRPAAKTDSTNGIGVRGTARMAPERKDTLPRSESTDGGVLLIDNDTEMGDMPNADPSDPSGVWDKIHLFNSELLSKCESAMDCSRTTPAKEYQARISMSAGASKTTPNNYGYYSPVRGQAARLGLDESPFFPKSLQEYNKVVAETNAEARARDRIREERVRIWPCLKPEALKAPWSRYGACEPGNAYDEYSSTLHSQARVEIKYEDLNRGMRDLFDYIDSPET